MGSHLSWPGAGWIANLVSISRRARARRVLVVTNDLSRSGAPRLVVEMATSLRRQGLRPIVLSPMAGPAQHDLADAGIPVVVGSRSRGWQRLIVRLANRCGIAICNTVDTADVAAIIGPRIPTLWYLHEVSLLTERLALPDVVTSARVVARVWAGSPVCADLIRPLRPDVDTVPYGLRPLTGSRQPDDAFHIGVFGSFEKRKGQDLVVEALTQLRTDVRDGTRVHLWGRVLDEEFASSIRASHDPMLSIHGETDAAGYGEAIGGVHAVLVSSRDDTLPLVSLDALGLGKTLLLTPSVGTSAYLTDGVDALIASETSPQGIAEVITRAFDSRADSLHMGPAARSTFQTHFSIERFDEKLTVTVADMRER